MGWNEFRKINKTRTLHACECTGKEIPIGSSCWEFVGEYEGMFQHWFCSNEAHDYIQNNVTEEYSCDEIGDAMREAELNANG